MKLKVLFHVNDMARWARVLTNARNFINDVGPGQADIEVVANGAAVMGFVEQNTGACGISGCGCAGGDAKTLTEEMTALNQSGVNFAACNNALSAHGLNAGMLLSFVSVVPAGITAIAQRQGQGYAYIKP